MDAVTFDVAGLLQYFRGFVTPTERLFAGYLASSLLLLAGLAWRETRADAPRAAFWRRCFPARIWWHPSARLDYRYFVVNRILFGLLFLPIALQAYPLIRDLVHATLSTHFAAPGWTPGVLRITAYTIGAVMAMDFGVFLGHYLQHRLPWLWEFHKVHHSAEVMTPLTAYRQHPVDDLGAMLLSGSLSGVFAGAGGFLFATPPSAFTVLGLNVVLFGFYLLGFHLRHSHVWLSFGRLDRIFVSPAMHQIHHSSDPRHFDRNFGLVFSCWDQLFRTAWLPRERETLSYGLSRTGRNEYTSLARLYLLPFAKLLARRQPGRLGRIAILMLLPVLLLLPGPLS